MASKFPMGEAEIKLGASRARPSRFEIACMVRQERSLVPGSNFQIPVVSDSKAAKTYLDYTYLYVYQIPRTLVP